MTEEEVISVHHAEAELRLDNHPRVVVEAAGVTNHESKKVKLVFIQPLIGRLASLFSRANMTIAQIQEHDDGTPVSPDNQQ